MESSTTAFSSQDAILDTLESVNLTAREGFNQIEAIAQCMKMILERPDRKDHLVQLAHMATTIRDLSQSSRDNISFQITTETGLEEMGVVEYRLLLPAGPDSHLQGAH